ncbi:DUF6544 family protein [Maritalea sp.]|uniref:DUF6544 family protein n=1 Tax=Maritalea sp. TaxID=2003361 RepID=UPI0039E2D75A
MLKIYFLYAIYFVGAAIALLVAIGLWFNYSDRRALVAVNKEIWQYKDLATGVYDPAMVGGLPEGVQRYFSFMIAPGALLKTINRIEMVGEFGLGDVNKHNYFAFDGIQYNAAPQGFTWSLKTKDNLMAMNGDDTFWAGEAWTKFWLLWVFPVARAGGISDYQRSGFGRVVTEMAAWSPVSLLPQFGAQWEQLSPNLIRATVRAHGLEQAVDITIDARGAPTAFLIQRWSNSNASQVFKLQPFGGVAHTYATVDGITFVSEVEAGNHFGTPDYFPFFKAKVTKFEFQPTP